MPKFQPPFVQYDAAFPQMGQIPRAQTALNYAPSNPNMNHYCAMGLNQASRDAIYMQWPSPTMMYAHSYEQFRHSVFQVRCNSDVQLFLCPICLFFSLKLFAGDNLELLG